MTVYNSAMNKEINDVRRKLGERIRELRKSAELTQEKFGELSGLSYKFIGELERGQVNVSLDSLAKIAEALKVKVGDLFSEERIPVQKVFVFVREKNPLSKLSPQNIQLIKKALRFLNRTFSKV
jgi:transcriptional regulator with XRE-family HTH domain